MKVGAPVKELLKKYNNIYKHRMPMGEFLYEACNQKELVVTTFVEAPWSPGFITSIAVKKENDVTVCRDSTGSLPDYSIKPSTVRGVKLGDDYKVVLTKYGQPTEKCFLGPNEHVWRYRPLGADNHLIHKNFAVIFNQNKISRISFSAEIKGKDNPFYNDGRARFVKCKPIP